MSESLGSAVLRLEANPAPLTAGLASARAKTIASMKGTSAASAAAFAAGMVTIGAAVGVGLFKIGQEYETAFNTIRTETGATGEKMEALKKSFKNVFGSSPADAKDVATALAEIHKRTGQVGEPLENLTLQFLRLSSATGSDVKTNVQSVTRAFNDWGVETKNQGKTLDGFFAVSQKTGIAVSDLASYLVQFGSPLRALGFDVEEAAAMFGAFERAGVNVSTMMPGLRMALKNIAKPTDDLAAKFKQLGVDTSNPKQALSDIMSTIEGMKNPTQAASFAMEVFGTRAGTDMAQAIREGRFEVDDLVKTMKNSKGAIEENAAANATLGGRMEILKHRVMNLMEPIATKLVTALTDLAGVLLDLSDKFNALPGPVKQGIGFVALFATGITGLAVAISKAKLAFMAMQTVMAANPYLLLIGATVAIAVLIVKNWDEIRAFLEKAWKGIKETAQNVWGGIREFFKKNWAKILFIFGGPIVQLAMLLAKNWDTIREATGRAWDRIRDLIKFPFERAAQLVKTVATGVAGFLAEKWSAIREKASDAWSSIRDRITAPFKTAKETVTNVVQNLTTWLRDAWDRIVTSAKNLGVRIRNALVDAFTGIVDEIKSVIEDIKDLPGTVLDGIAGNFSASVSAPFGTTIASPGIPTPLGTGAASSSAANGPAPTVNISFADGMGWLREFINVEIDGHGHEAGQVWIAGAGGVT